MAGKRIDSPLMRQIDRQGYRRDHVAAMLGIGPWTLSRIEAGVQPAPAGFYERAAAFLHVSIDDVRPSRALLRPAGEPGEVVAA